MGHDRKILNVWRETSSSIQGNRWATEYVAIVQPTAVEQSDFGGDETNINGRNGRGSIRCVVRGIVGSLRGKADSIRGTADSMMSIADNMLGMAESVTGIANSMMGIADSRMCIADSLVGIANRLQPKATAFQRRGRNGRHP